MIKNVRIRERKNNEVIGEFPITIETEHPTDDDFYQYAWDNAVSQSIADENRRSDYDFEIIEDSAN